MPRIRRIVLGIWVALTLALTLTYAFNPEWLEPERVVAVLRDAPGPVLLGYVVLSIIRPFTLLPSTVLIIVGTFLLGVALGEVPIVAFYVVATGRLVVG